MTTFMPTPPATTFLEFYPQDHNVITIGIDDSSIQIYNVRVDEVELFKHLFHYVKTKLKGHHKRISGLAFSNSLNVLIFARADSQVN
ncbi:hypothetical protein MTR67_026719 [Solanum verrucosum]|uniref:Uncharacterized protein n=1 Tax=Solanum verrucosum TaxID=315347 RepID=A0AAF0R8A3_SOLVR|nr:hypothetical protein MTR67_026719 [Solanum verrucosum]